DSCDKADKFLKLVAISQDRIPRHIQQTLRSLGLEEAHGTRCSEAESAFIRTNLWLSSYLTSKSTADPAITFSPATGFCVTTRLAGENSPVGERSANCGEMVTFPTRSPASCKTGLTLPIAWPTKLGITKACCCEGCATSRLIFGAAMSLAFAGGFCAST